LKYNPQDDRAMLGLAGVLTERHDYARAEKLYREVILLNRFGSVYVAYYNLGRLYRTMGKFDWAVQTLNDFIALNPGELVGYKILSGFYLAEKDYAASRKVLESYLAYGYGSPVLNSEVFLQLARVAISEKDINGALDYLNKALAINPGDAELRAAIMSARKVADSEAGSKK